MKILGINGFSPLCACIMDKQQNFWAISENSPKAEKDFGESNEIDDLPLKSIMNLLGYLNIMPDELSAIATVGKNCESSARALNRLLVHPLNRQGWRDVIVLDESAARAAFFAHKHKENPGILVQLSRHFIKAYRLSNGMAQNIDLQLDPDEKLSQALTKLFSTKEGTTLFKMLEKESYPNSDYSLYHSLIQAFPINPNGRIEVNDNWNLDDLFEDYQGNDHEKIQSALNSLRRWFKEMALHLLQYVKYVTQGDNLVLDGDIAALSFSRPEMLKYVPFKNVCPPHYPEGLATCAGACLLATQSLSQGKTEDDKQIITGLLNKSFENFREKKLIAIKECFHNANDPILLVLQDAFLHCKDILFTFDIQKIVFNSTKRLAFGLFDFLVFANYKDTGYPFIVKHKCIAYLKIHENNWLLQKIQFTIYDADPILTIEITDHCNYRCIMCDQNRRELVHGSKKGLMNYEMWQGLIDGIGKKRMGTITPFWLGESLLNPDFGPMIQYAFRKNQDNSLFINLTLNTNGSMMNSQLADTLLKCAKMPDMAPNTLMRIHFSLDATSKETFKRVHQVDLFDRTRENILGFLKKRQEMGLDYPLITLAFIVMEENQHEAPAFVQYWSNILREMNRDFDIVWDWPILPKDAIYIRRLDFTQQFEAEKLHKKVVSQLGLLPPELEKNKDERILKTDSILLDPKARKYKRPPIRRPCPGPWRTPIINWNGDITVCCFDIDLKLKIGNLKDSSFEDLWHGPRIESWRMAHIKGDLSRLPLCAGCGNLNAPVMSDADFVRYLIETKRIEEIQPFLDRMGFGL